MISTLSLEFWIEYTDKYEFVEGTPSVWIIKPTLVNKYECVICGREINNKYIIWRFKTIPFPISKNCYCSKECLLVDEL